MTVIALVAAALTVFGSLNVARIMLSDKGYLIVSLVDGPTLRACAGAPMTAGLAIQASTGLDALPIAPWAGMGMPATYAGVGLGLGTMLFPIRDAQ